MLTTFFLVALSVYSYKEIQNLIDSSNWITHTNRVTFSLERIANAVIEAETNQKSFLLIGDSSCLVKRDSILKTLAQELHLVDSLTLDNPQQRHNVKLLHAAIDQKLLSMQKVLDHYTVLNLNPQFKANVAEGIIKTKDVRQIINTMSVNESYLLKQRTAKYSTLSFITPVVIVVFFLGALLILFLSYLKINNEYHQAKILERQAVENASKLKETLIEKKLLEESEQRYHQLIHSSPSAIGVLSGEDLVITTANEPIIQIWGKGKEIIGKKYFEALPELAEQGYDAIFANVYKTGTPYYATETPVQILQDGVMTLKYYNFILYPQRHLNGTVHGIGIIATEVTSQALLNNKVKESEQNYRELSLSLEQKVKERTTELMEINEVLIQNEERYHLMVGEVQDYAIILLNTEGIVENWNRGAEKIKGYKAEEIIGKSFSNFYTPEDRAKNIPDRLLKHAVQTGKATDENWRVRKDGSKFWGSVVITSLYNTKNKLIGFVKVTRDLTERKKAEDEIKAKAEQLEIKNTELEKMNRELQSFAYISSHDLQEPLRKIQTFATRITEKEEKNLSDHGKDMFNRMQDAAKRMQTLIEDLLAYSRTTTATAKFENTDLNKIIEEVKKDLKEDIREKHATIEATQLCDANIIPFQFRQLMNNLIGNALKFSTPGQPPHIKILSEITTGSNLRNEKLSPHHTYCHITVSDNGIGFEQQYQEKIFEVFQRLHSKSQYNGTGIGLAIVKKIVDNHNGIITATGELNKGATFDIYIPVG